METFLVIALSVIIVLLVLCFFFLMSIDSNLVGLGRMIERKLTNLRP